MLDIFGNVFGKSNKKSNNASSSNQNGSNDETNDNEANDGYVFVSHNESQRTQFGQTTILTDELIRMGSSSSVLHANANNNNQSTGVAYPSLDINGVNPNLPFASSSSQQRNSLNISNVSNSFRNASPIDNVPFLLTNSSGGAGGSGIDEDSDVADILNRIQQFVNNTNLSEYNFKLENSILRESLLT